jgi:hypothetical protein
MAQINFLMPKSQLPLAAPMLGRWHAEFDNLKPVVETSQVSEPVVQVRVYELELPLTDAVAVPVSLRIQGLTKVDL